MAADDEIITGEFSASAPEARPLPERPKRKGMQWTTNLPSSLEGGRRVVLIEYWVRDDVTRIWTDDINIATGAKKGLPFQCRVTSRIAFPQPQGTMNITTIPDIAVAVSVPNATLKASNLFWQGNGVPEIALSPDGMTVIVWGSIGPNETKPPAPVVIAGGNLNSGREERESSPVLTKILAVLSAATVQNQQAIRGLMELLAEGTTRDRVLFEQISAAQQKLAQVLNQTTEIQARNAVELLRGLDALQNQTGNITALIAAITESSQRVTNETLSQFAKLTNTDALTAKLIQDISQLSENGLARLIAIMDSMQSSQKGEVLELILLLKGMNESQSPAEQKKLIAEFDKRLRALEGKLKTTPGPIESRKSAVAKVIERFRNLTK